MLQVPDDIAVCFEEAMSVAGVGNVACPHFRIGCGSILEFCAKKRHGRSAKSDFPQFNAKL